MVRNVDLSGVANKLTQEFDTLIEEREKVRGELAKLQARADEIERKLSGIQQTLQGLSLYVTAQETPTGLTKKNALAEIGGRMASLINASHLALSSSDVPKTLSECCRDILRKKGDWMSAVQVLGKH